MRINRYLASAGLGSRRSCEQLVTGGHVTVNGTVCRSLSMQISAGDEVRVHGRIVQPRRTHVYIALHKPAGVLSTLSDPLGRGTVRDYLPAHYGRIFHVGRLDKESEGLLLLTSDGELAQQLTHPRHHVDKEYVVTLDKPFDKTLIPKMCRGVSIEPGRARAESIQVVQPTIIRMVLRQGLKRQIRLMLARFGYHVKKLVRTRIGPLTLRGIGPGRWRELTPKEVTLLQNYQSSSGKPRNRTSVSA